MIPIEDTFEDVVGKAMNGLAMSPLDLAVKSGLSTKAIEALLAGKLDESDLAAVAEPLFLSAGKLLEMAVDAVAPMPMSCPGLRCFNTAFPVPGYQEMTVNSYLVWNNQTHEAYLFDTGAHINELVEFIESEGLSLQALFLTHTHRDHVAAYDAVLDAFKDLTVFTPKLEAYRGARTVEHGEVFKFGSIEIEARLTNGHSPGGMSYVVNGLAEPIAVVGDSLFSLSMGKANDAYALALKNNREQLLSLLAQTVLCPGHGPMTTVGFEQTHNPFF